MSEIRLRKSKNKANELSQTSLNNIKFLYRSDSTTTEFHDRGRTRTCNHWTRNSKALFIGPHDHTKWIGINEVNLMSNLHLISNHLI